MNKNNLNKNSNNNLNDNKNKNKFAIKLLVFVLCFLSFTFIIDFSSNKKIYATINKPTYSDMIKNKYKEKELSDEKAESLAMEESTLKDAYSKGLGKNEIEVTKKPFYGKYPNGFTGAVNFRKNNFLLCAYSLRDLNGAEGFQPLQSGLTNTLNYDHQGFNEASWKRYGMTSTNTVKWLLYQFEIKKLLRVYENVDYLVLSNIYKGTYENIISEKDTLKEVVELVGTNGLENLTSGDLLLSYDDENEKINYVGIYLGQDEEKKHYSMSPNKLAYNSKDYSLHVWALSYINSSDVYPQYIDDKLNFISGTKYNYGIKIKFLK